MSTQEEKAALVRICGPALIDPTPRQSFIISFGPKNQFTDEQLKKIEWFRNLGAKPSMKKNMISLRLECFSQEQYERLISILEREAFSYSVAGT